MSGEHHPAEQANTEMGLERIVFFSDAVMAIAITLLALDIRVPAIPLETAQTELPAQLKAMVPRFTRLVVSFVIIGVYWLSHHRYFEFIRRYDRRLIMINLLFLLCIILIPFATNMLGAYPLLPLPYVIYSLMVAVLGFSMWGIWVYATHHHRLVDPKLDARLIRGTAIRALFAPITFLLSIPVALVNPTEAIMVWFMSPVVVLIISRVMERARTNRTHRMNRIH